ncbi:MAG: class I SAM-dependent methyltransferase [Gemmatimonadaceae bacterium]
MPARPSPKSSRQSEQRWRKAVKPEDTGRRYDAIAAWWDAQAATMSAGVASVRRAIDLCAHKRNALDVGCGSGGRVIAALTAAGFVVVALDVSESMLALAKQHHPEVSFVHGDICQWEPPERYDLIVAWDSIFHVPHASQRPVVAKLCAALAPGGVILFTAGGIDGEITGEVAGEAFYYSSLADSEYLRILKDSGCTCVLLERDQFPEEHIVVIGAKTS